WPWSAAATTRRWSTPPSTARGSASSSSSTERHQPPPGWEPGGGALLGDCYYGGSANLSCRHPHPPGEELLMAVADLDLGRYKLGWSDVEDYVFKPEKGLNADIVRQMSWWKGEPDWMATLRQRALRTFERKPMLPWFAVNMP